MVGAGNGRAVAAVGPTRSSARAAASFLSRRIESVTACSLAGYLGSERAPGRIVLCPSGASLQEEIAFLRAAAERALWPAPDAVVLDAIEGLLGSLPLAAPRGRSRAPTPARPATALLLEGVVTSRRARAALAGDARLWIVERPGRVRVSRPLMETLRKAGVRWCALEPVQVVAVLASPRLAAARPRWRNLLPPATAVWVRKPTRRR